MDWTSSRFVLTSVFVVVGSAAIADSGRFELADGDRIAILGGDLIDDEIQYGYLETALTSALPRRSIQFRWFGGNGNTVWSETLGGLQLPEAGHRRLLALLREFQPTVILLSFGAEESARGDADVKRFDENHESLIDELEAMSRDYLGEQKLRVVLMTPHQLETHGPSQDADPRNRVLGLYAETIRQLAARRGARLVELFDRTGQIALHRRGSPSPAALGPDPPRGFRLDNGGWKSLPLTADGVRLSPYGSLRVARMVLQELNLPHAEFLLQLDSSGEAEADTQIMVSDFHNDGTQAKFKAIVSRLPEPPTPLFPQDVEYFVIAGGGLPSGNYNLKIDGKVAARNPTLLVGFPVRAGADYDQAEQLRRRTVAKNQVITNCWRPMDDAYLRVLRQSDEKSASAMLLRNAPLIKKLEADIADLKRPKARQYEIVPRGDEEK